MTIAKKKTRAAEKGRPKKTLSLRKETLRDLAPGAADVRGGVSGSGTAPRKGYPAWSQPSYTYYIPTYNSTG
jgi:hypothetical protein